MHQIQAKRCTSLPLLIALCFFGVSKYTLLAIDFITRLTFIFYFIFYFLFYF
ncbi:hypothetical protein CLU79DRAFT_773713 [Phycomyces nitens]|nr:hypothetical protein CLU79DRAFT_773713 [Phycomyces nitens]